MDIEIYNFNGGFLSHRGTPVTCSSIYFYGMFHEININHPAIGGPPLWKPPTLGHLRPPNSSMPIAPDGTGSDRKKQPGKRSLFCPTSKLAENDQSHKKITEQILDNHRKP